MNAEAGSERAGEPAIPFTYALRGYDRRQVDEAFSTLLAQLTAERQRVIAVQAELSAIAPGPGGAAANVAAVAGPDAAEGGPGNRMDTMLRAAEHEARELRDEARSVLAQAAAEAAAKRLLRN